MFSRPTRSDSDGGAQLCWEMDAVFDWWLVAPTQHVGSTAVPGLAAKPIIDVQTAEVDLGCAADAVAEVLSCSGWHLVPADFDARPWRRFLVRVSDGNRTAHPHLLQADSPRWAEQLAFRDALRADPALVHRYAELKRTLVTSHGNDRQAYTAGRRTSSVASSRSGRVRTRVEALLSGDRPTAASTSSAYVTTVIRRP